MLSLAPLFAAWRSTLTCSWLQSQSVRFNNLRSVPEGCSDTAKAHLHLLTYIMLFMYVALVGTGQAPAIQMGRPVQLCPWHARLPLLLHDFIALLLSGQRRSARPVCWA
jgi:hypothetical protein